MGIKKILNLFKKSPSNTTTKSNISNSSSVKMKSRRDTSADKKTDDWANRSGIYHKLSDEQKKYLEKVSKIIDDELKD
jgi:hypothetical protein